MGLFQNQDAVWIILSNRRLISCLWANRQSFCSACLAMFRRSYKFCHSTDPAYFTFHASL